MEAAACQVDCRAPILTAGHDFIEASQAWVVMGCRSADCGNGIQVQACRSFCSPLVVAEGIQVNDTKHLS